MMMMNKNIEKIYSRLKDDLLLREKINSLISERLEEVGLKMLNLYSNNWIKRNVENLTVDEYTSLGVFFMALCEEILNNE